VNFSHKHAVAWRLLTLRTPVIVAAFAAALSILPAPVFTGLVAAAPSSASARQALPRKVAGSTLAFNVTARLSSTGTGSSQTFSSRVQSKGNRVRIETKLGDRPVVFLASPPYLYKLIPTSKAGVRWENAKWDNSRFDIQTLLRNPAAIRTLLQQKGAKQVGRTMIDGVATDIFTARNVMGEGSQVKAWLRRSDALPVRMESRSSGLSALIKWTNYSRDNAMSDSLFRVPADYNIREAQGSPGLF
jgi:hypothetical protein